MINPFLYGKVVTYPHFVNRERELFEIRESLNGGNNVILYAPRRYGKTSLVLKSLEDVDASQKVYLDFFSVTSLQSFINVYLNTFIKTQSQPLQKLSELLTSFLRGITPSVSFDQTGKTNWSFQFNPVSDKEQSLSDVLTLPEKFASGSKRIYVVFDEFQEISKLNGDSFEKQLRSVLQQQKNVSYLFMGSKTHLLMNIFNSQQRALYNSGKLMSIGKIAEPEMHSYIKQRFESVGRHIEDDIVAELLSITGNIPYYNQFLASQLWLKMQEHKSVLHHGKLLRMAVESILSNQNEYYFTLYDQMTLYQRKLLGAIIKEREQVFSHNYQVRHNLSSPSSTQRALESLIDQGILERTGDSFHFTDPFFPRWLLLRNYA